MIIVSLVILALPLAHPLGDRADRHHPDLGAAGLHPAVLHGRHGQHHVAGRHRHLDRRAGRRRHRRGGERLQQAPPLGGRRAARATSTQVRLEALKEVGPSVFFSLLVIAVAFLPVFALVDQEGRLFKPLAYSKNLAMALAALLAITLDPALRMLFTRMDPFTFRPRWLARLATSVARRHLLRRGAPPDQPRRSSASTSRPAASCCAIPKAVIAAARRAGRRVASRSTSSSAPSSCRRSNEGTILYMPTTLPGHLGRRRRRSCSRPRTGCSSRFPEVERVFGKAGRAETSTDPAPFSMMETTVVLKPRERVAAEGRAGTPRWAPELAASRCCARSGPTASPGTSWSTRWTGRCASPASPTPGRCRSRRASTCSPTGVRTPVGIKVFGADLAEIERIGERARGGSCATSRAPAASSPSASPAATSSTSRRAATSSPATA